MTSVDPAIPEPHSRGTILLVEDEPFLREATARLLQSSGFDVIEAADATNALELFQDNDRHIDVLITDLSLPGGSGVQLGQDIRRKSPDLPILFTSGSEGTPKGVVRCVFNGVTPEEFDQTIAVNFRRQSTSG